METTLDQISCDLKLAEAKKHELAKLYQDLHSQSSSLLALTLHWQHLQSLFDVVESSLKTRFRDLESKERLLVDSQRSLRVRINEFEARETRFDARAAQFDAREAQFEARESDFDVRKAQFDAREAQFEAREAQFEAMKVRLQAREAEFEGREAEFEGREAEFEDREAEFAIRLRNLEAEELRIKSLAMCSKSTTTANTELVDFGCNGWELRFSSVNMDGKGLQTFLNERVDEHERIGDEVMAAMKLSLDPAKLVLDAMVGFYPAPWLSNGGKQFEMTVVRSSCVLLLEQLIRVSPQIGSNVRDDALRVASEWKEKMSADKMEVLGFLMLLGVYGLVPQFDKNEIARLFNAVEGYRLASELRRILGIPINNAEKIERALPFDSQLTKRISSPTESGPWPELKPFCINMDDNGLLLFLSENEKDHDAMQLEVYDALMCASDPLKLVLDALDPDKVENLEMIDVSIIKSYILLLEQLLKLSPHIGHVNREAAMRIAVKWKGKFVKKDSKPVNVLGFLQLVATIGLVSSFNAYELLSLLRTVYQHKDQPDTFRVIDLIHKFVHYFIKKKRLPDALTYIYAFNLAIKFPPVQLLSAYVDYWMYRSKKLHNERHIEQGEAIRKEANALRAVVKCIADFKLESNYAPDTIMKRIKQLEEKNVNNKCIEWKAQPGIQSRAKRPRLDTSIMDPQNSTASSSIVHSLGPSIPSSIDLTQQLSVISTGESQNVQNVPVVDPSIPSSIHLTQQLPVISTGESQNVQNVSCVSTSSLVTSIETDIPTTTKSIPPSTTSSTIQPTQPNNQTDISHPKSVVSSGEAKPDRVGTNSSTILSTQLQHGVMPFQTWQTSNQQQATGAPFSGPFQI